MQPSLTLCRAQEAHHLALSRATDLDNVKAKAVIAAAAWAKEGLAAGLREQRTLRNQEAAAAAAPRAAVEPPPADFRGLSENPDRGHANA